MAMTRLSMTTGWSAFGEVMVNSVAASHARRGHSFM